MTDREPDTSRPPGRDAGAVAENIDPGIWDQTVELFLRHSRKLSAITAAILGNEHDVEDTLQEGLITATRHLHELREQDKADSWFTTVFVRCAIDRARQRRRSWWSPRGTTSDLDSLTPTGSNDMPVDRRVLLVDAAQFLASLPYRQRCVFVLHGYLGWTISEIAQELHISENTVKTQWRAVPMAKRDRRSQRSPQQSPLRSPNPDLPTASKGAMRDREHLVRTAPAPRAERS